MKKFAILMLIFSFFPINSIVDANERKDIVLPVTWVLSQKEIFDKVWVKKSRKVETELPDKEEFSLAWNENTNLSFWATKLDKKDYRKQWYIVLPKQWLIMPLWDLTIDHSIYKEFLKWKDKKLNELMTRWAVNIPLSWHNLKFWRNWNKIIWWHSSYYKNDKLWKYKTHFQMIIWLEEWEEIWIYKHIEWTKWYQRYVYKVKKSYNHDSNNFSIIEDWTDKLTLFTCTPIWWISWRWIVEAEYVSQNKTK